jgi:hypothetical protein
MTLPSLIYNAAAKTGNEVQIFANYGVGRIIKRKTLEGDVTETSCGGSADCPSGSFNATVLQSVLGTVQTAFGGIPANAPMFTAVEGEATPAETGVNADYVCLPNPADDFLICFDRGFQASGGFAMKPIPRKFTAADHYVRQRSENTLSMTDLYVCNFKGLASIRGRRVTIIAKIYPQGGGSLQEVQYFSNVMLNMPTMNSQSDGNSEIEIQAEGNFDFCAVFSAAVV